MIRTPMMSGRQNSGFQRLAGFIFGGNQDESKAPVQPIAMTAPVITDRTSMAFVLPSSLKTVDQVPVPLESSQVQVLEMPEVEMAVLPFSGRATEEAVEGKVRELKSMLKQDELVADPESLILSQFNPPWTIPWFRYNEIAMKIIKSE